MSEKSDSPPATKDEAKATKKKVEGDSNEAPKKKSFGEKFQDFVAEYGAVGIITWFSIFGLTIVGFAVAFQFGLDVGQDEGSGDQSAAATGGVWLAAYIAAQATKPLRALATFALTPVLARAWKKFRGNDDEPAASDDKKSSDEDAKD